MGTPAAGRFLDAPLPRSQAPKLPEWKELEQGGTRTRRKEGQLCPGVGGGGGSCLGKADGLEPMLGAVGGTRTGSTSPSLGLERNSLPVSRVPGCGRQGRADRTGRWKVGPRRGLHRVGCHGRVTGGSKGQVPSPSRAARRVSTLHFSFPELSPGEWWAGEEMVSGFLEQLRK